MNKEVKKDILRILKDAQKDVLADDSLALKELSNHTIHNASIYQDEYSISTAVIVYALAKIVERTNRGTDFKLSKSLKKAHDYLLYDDLENFKKALKNITNQIAKVDKKVKLYLQEVIGKAEIKKAFKMHEHGLSVGRVCELLNISGWELVNYIGKTQMNVPITTKVGRRLGYARKIFNIK